MNSFRNFFKSRHLLLSRRLLLASCASIGTGYSMMVWSDEENVGSRQLKRTVTQGTKKIAQITDLNKMTSHNSPKTVRETEGSIICYDYVIIGTGTSAQAACELIKQRDPTSSMLIVTDYSQLSRPDVTNDQFSEVNLDHGLQGCFDRWRRQLSSHLKTMVMEDGSKTDVMVTQGFSGVKIDTEKKILSFKRGTEVSYKSCLIATPGKVRAHYVLDSTIQYALNQAVNPLKTLQDFKVLENFIVSEPNTQLLPRKLVVVGGGFLGTEVSSCLASLNENLDPRQRVAIYQVYFEENPLDTYLPKYLSRHVKYCLKEIGVQPLANRLVSDVKLTSTKVQAKLMTLSNEMQLLDLDYMVLASTRVDPDVEVASASGLEIDSQTGGVVVNSSLEAFRDVFVSGTSSSYFCESLGRRRVSIYDHAMNSGLTAARNMTSSTLSTEQVEDSHCKLSRNDTKLSIYRHLPAFRCDLKPLGIRFECVGDIDSRLRTIGVWLAKRNDENGQPLEETDFRRGVVYYIKNNKVVGVLCCNASECLDRARNLINDNRPLKDDPSRELKKLIKLGPDFWLRVYKT